MDADKILEELCVDRQLIEDAIASLEILSRSRGKRRGHPLA